MVGWCQHKQLQLEQFCGHAAHSIQFKSYVALHWLLTAIVKKYWGNHYGLERRVTSSKCSVPSSKTLITAHFEVKIFIDKLHLQFSQKAKWVQVSESRLILSVTTPKAWTKPTTTPSCVLGFLQVWSAIPNSQFLLDGIRSVSWLPIFRLPHQIMVQYVVSLKSAPLTTEGISTTAHHETFEVTT